MNQINLLFIIISVNVSANNMFIFVNTSVSFYDNMHLSLTDTYLCRSFQTTCQWFRIHLLANNQIHCHIYQKAFNVNRQHLLEFVKANSQTNRAARA